MKKYCKPITVILVILLVVVVMVGLYFYNSVPRLSVNDKRKIEAIYYSRWTAGQNAYKYKPLIWYDENGYVEEHYVWRYVGMYGDCYAFLVIGDNINAFEQEIALPFPIEGFVQPVHYPAEVSVVLYHRTREFSSNVVHGTDYDNDYSVRMCTLEAIHNREEWITDEQLEQLARDIEKLANEHN